MFLRDQLAFLRRLAANPSHVGAVAPSGQALARAMAERCDPARAGRVLELGPGTGVVTAALLARGFAPERIVAIEYDPHFANLLRARFGGVSVIEGDAFALSQTLGNTENFTAIVSSLPLLNFEPERREALIGDALGRLASGAPFVQFSYGLHPPVAPPEGSSVELAARIWFNLPPARVWVYRGLASP